ncbi:hypothetical protein PIB30_010594 [Stylosanthes scabra]|uniref:Uncharacterized protein n=1 Tax=Stylosanthes scabra TaxID=79078 RepID=A0ABU6T6I3_9FABA|nr:hypothetical protein [Stylosanthes scabra]
MLFKHVMADGKFAWAPSSGILPNGIEENGDGYRPHFEDANLDIEEGSRDSEEDIGDSVRVSTELQHINLSSSQESSSQKSTEKKKRVVICDAIEKKKKIKLPASKQFVDAISKIASASASETRSTTVNTVVVPGTSIGEVMVEIQNIVAITNDANLHSRCCRLMMFEPAREMFVTLKAHEQRLLDWLKFAAYKPLPFNQN